MEGKLKYVWNEAIENQTDETQTKLIEQISGMITEGCRVANVKRKFKQLMI